MIDQIENNNNKPEMRKAIDFLSPNRFDLIAKLIYVKFRDLKIQSDFARRLYLEHINAFNGYVENDGSNKIGKEAFLNSFNNVIDSIRDYGFLLESEIPLSESNSIIDGAHRTAAAIYYNKDILVKKKQAPNPNYNFNFFLKRGLKRQYLDAMAIEYATIKNNTYAVLIWPSAEGKEKELSEILNSYGEIAYRKDVYLTSEGSVQLVKHAYKSEKWLGNEKNNFIGARNKASWCFEKSGPLRVFLFESSKDLIKMKEEIRKVFNISKHAVHINDTKEETLELCGLLFNDNSLHWLNYSIVKNFPWFNRLHTHFCNWLIKEGLNPIDFCIDGSATLGAYGIREVRDLDYLYFGDYKKISTGFKEIDCHNEELLFHSCCRDEIIFNPENYFYYFGVKYISLRNILNAKSKRKEKKDLVDIERINALLSRRTIKEPFRQKIKRYSEPSYLKGKIKFQLLKLRYFLTFLRSISN